MKTGLRPFNGNRNGFLGVSLAALALLALAGPLRAADGQAGTAYLEGLENLSAGAWDAAAQAFSRAADADADNPDYLTARGVAQALAQRPAEAVKDLQRSLRMRADDWETKLWLGAALYMTGDAAAGSQYIVHGPSGRPATKDDLDYSTFVFNLGLGCWQCRQGGKARLPEGDAVVELSLDDLRTRQFPRAAAMFVARRKAGASPRLAGDLDGVTVFL